MEFKLALKKEIYLTNEKFSIASARKLLNLVKYTTKGEIKKASIKNKTKLDQELKKYEHIIKKGQTVDQMNKEINKALKTSDKKNKLLNKTLIIC